MLGNVFLIFFAICFIHLILLKIKLSFSSLKVVLLFYFPIILYLLCFENELIDSLYILLSYSILFVSYYFTMLGITNDSPSLIIIREILKKNTKIKNLKIKFLKEKLIEKRFKDLVNDNYIYYKKGYLKIKSNKIFLINIFILLRKLQFQTNQKNG